MVTGAELPRPHQRKPHHHAARACLLAVCALLFCPAATAEPLLVWPGPDETEWGIQLFVALPQARVVNGPEMDQQAELWAARITLRSTCRTGGGVGYELGRCIIDQVAILGEATEGEEEQLQAVLDHWQEALTGAEVQLKRAPEGHIVDVQLLGPSRRGARMLGIHEDLRQFASRAFMGFDLQADSLDGDPDGPRESSSDQLPVSSVMASNGALGKIRTMHQISHQPGDVIRVSSKGRGKVTPLNGYLDLELQQRSLAEAEIDPVDGSLITRRWGSVARQTAVSRTELQSHERAFLQAGQVVALGPDEPLPFELGPTKAGQGVFIRTPATELLYEVDGRIADDFATREPSDEPPAYVLGVSSLGLLAANQTGRLVLGLHSGVRLPSGFWLGVAVDLHSAHELELAGIADTISRRDALLVATAAPNTLVRRTTVLLELGGGLSFRSHPGALVAPLQVPVGRARVGLRYRIAKSLYADAAFASTLDLQPVHVRLGPVDPEQLVPPWAFGGGLSLLMTVP